MTTPPKAAPASEELRERIAAEFDDLRDMDRDFAVNVLLRILRTFLAEKGLVVVPILATMAMRDAGANANTSGEGFTGRHLVTFNNAWEAALAAAPSILGDDHG